MSAQVDKYEPCICHWNLAYPQQIGIRVANESDVLIILAVLNHCMQKPMQIASLVENIFIFGSLFVIQCWV